MITIKELDSALKEKGITSFYDTSHFAVVTSKDGFGNEKTYEARMEQLTGMILVMPVYDVQIFDIDHKGYTDEDFAREFPSHAEHLRVWQEQRDHEYETAVHDDYLQTVDDMTGRV